MIAISNPKVRASLLTLATLCVAQACAKESQTDRAVETQTDSGTLATSMSGDSADKRGVALVRVVNVVPSASDLQVRADDQHMLPKVGFQRITTYTPIDQSWVNFQVGDANATSFTPLNTNRELLTDGHRYTIVVLRGEDGTSYETRVIKDAIETDSANARIRVIHAAPGAGEVQLRARNAEDTMFDGVDYGDDDGFKTIPPYNGVIEVRSNDGKTVLLRAPTMKLDAGKSYTLVLSRTAQGKLDAFWFEDAQVS